MSIGAVVGTGRSRRAADRARDAPVGHVGGHPAAQPGRRLLRPRGHRHRGQRGEPEGVLGAARRPPRLRRPAQGRRVRLVAARGASTSTRSPPRCANSSSTRSARSCWSSTPTGRGWSRSRGSACSSRCCGPLLEIPVCIHVTREPLEVAGSVAKRNGFPLPVGLALWEHYTLRSLQASVGRAALPRALRGPRRRPGRHRGPAPRLARGPGRAGPAPSVGARDHRVRRSRAPPPAARLRRPARDAERRAGRAGRRDRRRAAARPQWEQREPSESASATLRDFEARVDELTRAATTPRSVAARPATPRTTCRAARDETDAARRHAAPDGAVGRRRAAGGREAARVHRALAARGTSPSA